MAKSLFKCKKCEFATTRKDELNTHIAFWHCQYKVKCPECPAEFIRKGSMELHRRITHPKDTLASTPNQDWVEELEREEAQRQIGLDMCGNLVRFCVNKD